MSFVKRNPFRVNNYESFKVAALEIAAEVFTNQTVEKLHNFTAKRVDKLTHTTIDKWDAEDITFLVIILLIIVVGIVCFFLKPKKSKLPACSINSLRSAFYENQASMSNTRMWQIISCAGNVANFREEQDKNVPRNEEQNQTVFIKQEEKQSEQETEVYVHASAYPIETKSAVSEIPTLTAEIVTISQPSESKIVIEPTEEPTDEGVTSKKPVKSVTKTSQIPIARQFYDRLCKNKKAKNPEPLIIF